MPVKLKYWIEAIRIRTLLLSFSCIGMGVIVAYQYIKSINVSIAILTTLTALFLQILSNLANDYGDSIHGADSANRKGPIRAVQSGKLSKEIMKKGVVAFAILSFISGVVLLYLSIAVIGIFAVLFLFALGILSIVAAILYTNGKKPYGYAGLGDISVFIFFGLIAVCGTFYLQTGLIVEMILLPASTMGFLAAGVLNINNMRDIDADKIASKKSIPVRLGFKKSKIYHVCIILSALILLQIYAEYIKASYWFMLPFPLFLAQLLKIIKCTEPEKLDPLLKELSVSTFLLVLLFAFSVIYAGV